MRHWLYDPTSNTGLGSGVLSLERAPSPDGVTNGVFTYYDYDNKYYGAVNYIGTNAHPRCVAQIQPDSNTYFQYFIRDSRGNVTNRIETYTATDGTIARRTNVFFYASNGIDLVAAYGPNGERTVTNTYNSYHQVLTSMNASNEVSTYIYNDTTHLLMTNTRPSGLTNFYTYDSTTRFLTNLYQLPTSNTVSYTYSNGRVLTTTDARSHIQTNYWDALGRLVGTADADGTTSNIFTVLDITAQKDHLGNWTYASYNRLRLKVLETNANSVVTAYGYCDCGALEYVTNAFGTTVQEVTEYFYDYQGHVTAVILPDGFIATRAYDTLGRITNSIDPSGTNAYYYNIQGLRTAVTNSLGQVSKSVYDIENRVYKSTDQNGVTVTNTYDNLGRVLTRRYSDGGVESFGYTANISGATTHTDPISNVTTYTYDAAGRKKTDAVAGVYTNSYTYTAIGDLYQLTDGKSQKTLWNYDHAGRVTNKIDNTGVTNFVYTYDANGRLTTRLDAKSITTTYRYDVLGNLTNVVYPNNTAIVMKYDALNRLTNQVDGVGTSAYAYYTGGLLKSEDGPWSGDTVTYSYTRRLRTAMTLGLPSGGSQSTAYTYDAVNRLKTLTSPAGTFTYAYSNNPSSEVLSLTLPNGAYIANTFDSMSRELTTKLYNSSATALNTHAYTYNLAGQRTAQTFTAGDYVNYGYDAAGELLTAKGYESGGTTRLNEQFQYKYDAAGNLSIRTNNALIQTFAVNSLNQLSTVARTGTLTVSGTTGTAATSVTVNTTNATVYADATFALAGITPTNGVNTYTAIATDSLSRKDTNAVTVNLPASASYTYDANGNLTSDGLRSFYYDDENQLTNVTVAGSWKTEFIYDGLMRRRVTKEYTYSGSSYVKTNETRYIYDGNLVIQERDANNIPLVTYTRGKDLSGSAEGAGGIGGLLARTDLSTLSSQPSSAYYHSDANGNITCLINSSQVPVARYHYDPYGNLLSKTGPLADANVYRFSSKEWHEKSGLVYYLYRYYEPNLQRWLNRDPIVELGWLRQRGEVAFIYNSEPRFSHADVSVVRFCANDPVGRVDIDGCSWWPWSKASSAESVGETTIGIG
jgi:RHS repeat-associated protein